MSERPLSALRPGDRATIGRVEGGGPIRRRLLELGLTPGTPITLVRLAPLRDPMEIRVRGYQLCVRRSEADAVWVRTEPAVMEQTGTGTRTSSGKATCRPAEGLAAAAAVGVASSPIAPPGSMASEGPAPKMCLWRPPLRVLSLAFAPLRAFCSR